MRSCSYFRGLYKFKSDLSIFFKKYKWAILLLCSAFIIGIIAGIFTASKYSGSLELENMPDENLVAFLCGDKGSFGVFFSYLISVSIAVLLIVFFNFNSFTAVLTFIYLLVRGYTLGFVIFALIALFSFSGIINVIIIIIPFGLCINFLIILISAICVGKNKIIKKFGRVCYNSYNPRKIICLLFVLLVATLFLMCMVMPVIKITIIVN